MPVWDLISQANNISGTHEQASCWFLCFQYRSRRPTVAPTDPVPDYHDHGHVN
jgi:hypothetical protein